jgi:arylsulfatase A-like enzyme
VSLVVGFCCLVVGCGTPATPPGTHGGGDDVGFLNGLMVTDAAVTVAPDRHWSEHPDGGSWSFRNSAGLVVRAHRDVSSDLVFRLVPDETAGRFHFTAHWDDEPLIDGPARLPTAGIELAIAADLVTTGDHVLTIKRIESADAATDRSIHDNGFRELEWRLGDVRRRLLVHDRKRLRYVGAFLDRGLTGMSRLQMAGCLFEGPQTLAADIAAIPGGSLVFHVENNSSSVADFTAGTAGSAHTVAVAPGAIERWEIPAGGGGGIELTVSGPEDGLYLWGAPFLRKPAGPERSRIVTTERSRIVLITLDTTRRDALSPYGASRNVTPNLQRFADGATVFDRAYAVSPWTLPSHASLFTGLYPSRHGAGVWQDHLPLEFHTVAELLRDRGHATAGFAGGEMCSTTWGVGQGFSSYRNPEGFETRGDRLTDLAIEFLDHHRYDDFFLFVNYFDPHALYEAPDEFKRVFDVERLSKRLLDTPVWRDLVEGNPAAWRRIITGEAETGAAALEFLRAAYTAEVAFMDQQIGRLLDALRDRELYDGATIVMVSDHGELLGEYGFFSHCCRLDPELVEIPLLIKFPGQTTPVRVSELVSHVDIFTTLLGSPAAPNDGIGLDAVAALEARDTVYMEEHESRIHPLHRNMVIARHLYGSQRLDSRELVWKGGIRCSDLVDGSWADTECAEAWNVRLRQLEDVLKPRSEPAEVAGTLSEDERRRLEALGYVR